MVQHMPINKRNTTHKQNKGQKLYDHLHGCRKAFDKIQHPFMIKALKNRNRKNMPQLGTGGSRL
jgi:hypothetical protein